MALYSKELPKTPLSIMQNIDLDQHFFLSIEHFFKTATFPVSHPVEGYTLKMEASQTKSKLM